MNGVKVSDSIQIERLPTRLISDANASVPQHSLASSKRRKSHASDQPAAGPQNGRSAKAEGGFELTAEKPHDNIDRSRRMVKPKYSFYQSLLLSNLRQVSKSH
jgi:hypothetical protein